MSVRRTIRRGVLLFGLMSLCVALSDCTGLKAGHTGMNGKALIGLTQERLSTCSGAPLREIAQPASTLLVYYNEATVLEESFGGNKGSKLGYHHGCWATLLTEQGRVTGVEFRPVPDPDADTHECQDIFAACAS